MSKPAIIVHGGCGRIDESTLPERLDGVRKAAAEGWKALQEGGSSVDAVESAVLVLEDSPLFNAGRGSVLNSEGKVETDASIMDGSSLAAGAIAGVTGIRNPIQLARHVMEASPHVMLIGEGAERFAAQQKFERYPPEYFVVEYRRKAWEREHGTVGATACDREGHLAAATSTGGSAGKRPGRIGDTPIIGAGTYADSAIAISCTGNGEHIIRMTLARLVAFLYQRYDNAQKAAEEALEQLETRLGGEVGMIAVDCSGKVAFTKNSPHMPVCVISEQGVAVQC